MRRSWLSLTVAAAVAGFAGPCRADPTAASEPSSADLPFYETGGVTLTPPPPPSSKSPFVIAPSLNVSELFIPEISSNAAWVQPMLEVGNDLWSGGIGYGNLARRHGVDFDLSLGQRSSASRIFDQAGWRGSFLWPDLHARFSYYPGSSRLPSVVFGGTSRMVGFMFAKCLGKVSIEMSGSAYFGVLMVKIDSAYVGIPVGGHFEVGVAL